VVDDYRSLLQKLTLSAKFGVSWNPDLLLLILFLVVVAHPWVLEVAWLGIRSLYAAVQEVRLFAGCRTEAFWNVFDDFMQS